MTPTELYELSLRLNRYYGERFPPLSNGMAERWYEDLRQVPWDVALQALRRWSGAHTLKAPSLVELLDVIDEVERERRRAGDARGRRMDEPRGDWGLNEEAVRRLIRSIWPEYREEEEARALDLAARKALLREQGRRVEEGEDA